MMLAQARSRATATAEALDKQLRGAALRVDYLGKENRELRQRLGELWGYTSRLEGYVVSKRRDRR
jgi:hypothetical protein